MSFCEIVRELSQFDNHFSEMVVKVHSTTAFLHLKVVCYMRERIAKSQGEIMHHEILSISSSGFLFWTEPEERVETGWILKFSHYRGSDVVWDLHKLLCQYSPCFSLLCSFLVETRETSSILFHARVFAWKYIKYNKNILPGTLLEIIVNRHFFLQYKATSKHLKTTSSNSTQFPFPHSVQSHSFLGNQFTAWESTKKK